MSDSESDSNLSGFIVSDSEEEERSDWSDDEAEEMEVDSSEEDAAQEPAEELEGGIDPSNIITGKRTRRPTNRYVHPNMGIMCDDIPESEMQHALDDSVGSEDEISSGASSEGEGYDSEGEFD